ncbi:hypothetical protein ACFQV2_20760 [Actinokineospora soli]|uniref:PEP-CTERM protein-sorting domain-containing protein n=1 Tax=Actinokineospora soli TaxID=1048753 RepID=A0ABW2TRP5_9PSEU
MTSPGMAPSNAVTASAWTAFTTPNPTSAVTAEPINPTHVLICAAVVRKGRGRSSR